MGDRVSLVQVVYVFWVGGAQGWDITTPLLPPKTHKNVSQANIESVIIKLNFWRVIDSRQSNQSLK